ncbi:hypothetical protein JRQ81_017684 [Phrynocephalus forsythii]|uniref:Uncharacterized protein n=1 Tax=Phrynocephalus forsythii TaxID=171643 RepID=A0A9Q0XRC9_9SAUR|nr:hypothetical protein JRQ81_017684 [Phrynocephalus forsythii]
MSSRLFKIVSYQGPMGAYQWEFLTHLHPLLELIPKDKRLDALAIYEEAMALAAQQIRSSRHAFNCTNKLLGASITLCCHAWLCSTGLSEDHKNHIELLPFEGDGLFHPLTDNMEDHQKRQTTAIRLNVVPQRQQWPFRFHAKRSNYNSEYHCTYSRQQPCDCSIMVPSPFH